MRYHNITKMDMANGEGIRVVLWLAGCNHKCTGCHNPQTWDCKGGLPFDQKAVIDIITGLDAPECDGITFSGGDPLHPNNREKVLLFAQSIKECYTINKKTCWLYTGYLWEDIKDLENIEYIDVLIDGKYMEELSNPSPKWRGSSNQRIIDVKKSLKEGKVVLYDK